MHIASLLLSGEPVNQLLCYSVSCYIYQAVCHLVRSHYWQKQNRMAFNPGTNVWGKTYRENREKSLAAWNSAGDNIGQVSYSCSSINYGGVFQSNNQLGGYTNAFPSTFVTNSSGFQANHHFGRYQNASSNTTRPLTSCCTPEKRLDWGYMVESVFQEEIGKMAKESKNEKC